MYKKSTILWRTSFVLFLLLLTTSNGRNIREADEETGELDIDERQYGLVVSEETEGDLPAVQLREHVYSALQVDIDNTTGRPVDRCLDLYKEFMDKNRAYFQNCANKQCSIYFGVWCCPYGGCRFFVMKPYRLCHWREPIYKPKIPVWEWPQHEVELPEKEVLRI